MTESPRLTYAAIAVLLPSLIWAVLVHPAFLPPLSSDSLYIDDLWLSFFDGRGFRHWMLPPAPSFFPDLLIYAFSTLAGPDLGLRHAVYALLQAAWLAAGAAAVLWRWAGLGWPQAALTALSGMAFFSVLLPQGSSLGLVLTPTHHGSCMAASLWMLALAPEKERPLGRLGMGFWAMAVALLFVSDKLILLWGILPLAAVLELQGSLKRGWILAVLAGLFLSSALSALMRSSGGPQVAQFMTAFFSSRALPLFLGGLESLKQTLALEAWMVAMALAWFSWAAWKFSRILGCFGVSGSLLSLLLISTGNFSMRYFYPFFFTSIIFSPALLSLRRDSLPAFTGLGLGIVLILRCLAWPSPSLESLRAPQPDGLQALEAALGEPSRVKGYADYWQARRLRMLSLNGIWIESAITVEGQANDFVPYFWISNTRTQPFQAHYVVVNGLNDAILLRKLGKPDQQKRFGELEVWFYKKELDLRVWRQIK